MLKFISAIGIALSLVGLWGSGAAAARAEDGFALRDDPGKHLDVLLDGRIAARYMYAYDMSSKQRREETYKPYLHVFDAAGSEPITKGPGFLYTHHRGIFIGWNKIHFNNKTYDRWHMIGGEIVHQKFLAQKAGDDAASFTSLTHWNDPAGKPLLLEERTMTFHRGEAPVRLVIDFHTKLTAPRCDLTLGRRPGTCGRAVPPGRRRGHQGHDLCVSQGTCRLPQGPRLPVGRRDLRAARQAVQRGGSQRSHESAEHALVGLSRLRPFRGLSRGQDQEGRVARARLSLPGGRRSDAAGWHKFKRHGTRSPMRPRPAPCPR